MEVLVDGMFRSTLEPVVSKKLAIGTIENTHLQLLTTAPSELMRELQRIYISTQV
jgi:hypothetical protein